MVFGIFGLASCLRGTAEVRIAATTIVYGQHLPRLELWETLHGTQELNPADLATKRIIYQQVVKPTAV